MNLDKAFHQEMDELEEALFEGHITRKQYNRFVKELEEEYYPPTSHENSWRNKYGI